MNAGRILALLSKEVADVRSNWTALLPVPLMSVFSLTLPFVVTLLIPRISGQPLSGDPVFRRAAETLIASGDVARMGTEGAVQAFLYQQFLLLQIMMPIAGSMALAAHSIIGEKQARTLEPLLATPLTIPELLVTKVVTALVFPIAMMFVAFFLYVAVVALTAAPGVVGALFSVRSLVLVLVIGPLAALVALQAAAIVSSRVNDPRTAQQFGVLIILPFTVLLIMQFKGAFLLSVATLWLIALALAAVWVLLAIISVAVFDRETILTRWK